MSHRFLKHTKTGQYWGETGWVHHIEQALDFPDMSTALSVFNLRQLQDTEFFMEFGDKPNPQVDIHFALAPPSRPGITTPSRSSATHRPKIHRPGSKESTRFLTPRSWNGVPDEQSHRFRWRKQ